MDSQSERQRIKGRSRWHHEAMRLSALALVLLLAGCSAAPPATIATIAPASLKESCDKLKPLTFNFGQVPPTTERYAEHLPKFQAVADAGDQATKDALAPLLDSMSKGAAGDSSALIPFAGAMVALVDQCKAAGSVLGQP